MNLKRVNELNAVLSDWDEATLPDNRKKVFSVGFVTKSGEFRFVRRGVKSGLRFNMKETDYKAVQPVDREGNEIGHVTPVWIHSILFYLGNVKYSL